MKIAIGTTITLGILGIIGGFLFLLLVLTAAHPQSNAPTHLVPNPSSVSRIDAQYQNEGFKSGGY